MKTSESWRKKALNLLNPIREVWHSGAIKDVEACVQKHLGAEAAAKYASTLFFNNGAFGQVVWIELQLLGLGRICADLSGTLAFEYAEQLQAKILTQIHAEKGVYIPLKHNCLGAMFGLLEPISNPVESALTLASKVTEILADFAPAKSIPAPVLVSGIHFGTEHFCLTHCKQKAPSPNYLVRSYLEAGVVASQLRCLAWQLDMAAVISTPIKDRLSLSVELLPLGALKFKEELPIMKEIGNLWAMPRTPLPHEAKIQWQNAIESLNAGETETAERQFQAATNAAPDLIKAGTYYISGTPTPQDPYEVWWTTAGISIIKDGETVVAVKADA